MIPPMIQLHPLWNQSSTRNPLWLCKNCTMNQHQRELRPPVGGVFAVLLGLSAAVLYTMANIALRHCITVDPFLVSAVKAAPTVIVLGPFLLWMLSWRSFGNELSFDSAFRRCGHLRSVCWQRRFSDCSRNDRSGCVCSDHSGSSDCEWGDSGTDSTGRACAFAHAGGNADDHRCVCSFPPQSSDPDASADSPWVGALCAAASECTCSFLEPYASGDDGGYRRCKCSYGLVGTISLSVTLAGSGLESISAVESSQWSMMAAAGVLNFSAFVALSVSLKSLPVVAVNLINASRLRWQQ